MLTNSEIHIRDPFVVADAIAQRYYLYGTTGPDARAGQPPGFDVYIGSDLHHWDGPYPAFRPAPDFWSDRNFWAPEVHEYCGRYYMFASFKAEGVCRGTQILVADSLKGPYKLHSERPVTPAGWECLDGTLFVDAAGLPWIVFCHEWVQVRDGEICAMPLTADLRSAAGEVATLFRATEAPWIIPFSGPDGFVTDGPFLYHAADGTLLMLWSSFSKGGYTLGVARSLSGHITGPWQQDADPLYQDDGGHGMLFRTFDGRLMLSVHSPNKNHLERPVFAPVRDEAGRLSIG